MSLLGHTQKKGGALRMGQWKRNSQRRKCKKARKAAETPWHFYHIQEIDCLFFFFFFCTQGDVGFCKAVEVLLASGDKKASWWLCPISVDLVEVRRAFDRSRLGNLRNFKARGGSMFLSEFRLGRV